MKGEYELSLPLSLWIFLQNVGGSFECVDSSVVSLSHFWWEKILAVSHIASCSLLYCVLVSLPQPHLATCVFILSYRAFRRFSSPFVLWCEILREYFRVGLICKNQCWRIIQDFSEFIPVCLAVVCERGGGYCYWRCQYCDVDWYMIEGCEWALCGPRTITWPWFIKFARLLPTGMLWPNVRCLELRSPSR